MRRVTLATTAGLTVPMNCDSTAIERPIAHDRNGGSDPLRQLRRGRFECPSPLVLAGDVTWRGN
jgi:hypothetical protein